MNNTAPVSVKLTLSNGDKINICTRDTVYMYGIVKCTRLRRQLTPDEIRRKNLGRRMVADKLDKPYTPEDVNRPYTLACVHNIQFVDAGEWFRGRCTLRPARAELERYIADRSSYVSDEKGLEYVVKDYTCVTPDNPDPTPTVTFNYQPDLPPMKASSLDSEIVSGTPVLLKLTSHLRENGEVDTSIDEFIVLAPPHSPL